MPTNPLPRLSAQLPATADTAPEIRNGVYQFSFDGHSAMTFRISTITSARTSDLVGKRVISRMLSTGDWKMFAFLTQTGELKLWQRFSGDDGRMYVERARTLLEFLRTTDDESYRIGGNHSGRIREQASSCEVSYTSLCQVCNQRIVGRDNRCLPHSTLPSAQATNVRSSFSAEPFEVVGEITVDVLYDRIEVPAAVTNRLAKSEITPSMIR